MPQRNAISIGFIAQTQWPLTTPPPQQARTVVSRPRISVRRQIKTHIVLRHCHDWKGLEMSSWTCRTTLQWKLLHSSGRAAAHLDSRRSATMSVGHVQADHESKLPSCVTIGQTPSQRIYNGPRLPAARRCRKRPATFSSVAVLSSSPLAASRTGGCLWSPDRRSNGSLPKSARPFFPEGSQRYRSICAYCILRCLGSSRDAC